MEPTRSPDSAWRSLALVVAALAAFGVALVLLPGPITTLFAWIAYGSTGAVHAFGPDALAYVQLVHAILGAVTVGWALTLVGIVARLARREPELAWWLVAAPALAWFVLDTGYSLVSGFWRNAVFNSLFAVALALPLARLRARVAARIERTPQGARS